MLRRRRQGFTMVELAFVITIGAVVLSIGTREFAKVADKRAVGNARDAFIMTSHQARSESMRSGTVVHFRIRPEDDEVRVATVAAGVLHTLDLSEYGVTMLGEEISVCYTARGYALPGCTSISAEASVDFVRGSDTASVAMLPLGQVRRTR